MSTQKLVFSSSDFDSVIDDMASHFKSDRRRQSYSGGSERLKALYESVESVSFADDATSQGGKADNKILNDFDKAARSDLKVEADQFQEKSTQYAKDLKGSSQDEFSKRIDKMAGEAKERFNKVVDKWAVKVKEIHAKFNLGDLLFSVFKGVCVLADKFFDSIVDFFNRVVEWVERAVSAIKEFFSGLVNTMLKLV